MCTAFRAARLALAAAAAALLGACGSLSGLDNPPRVTLVDVQPVQIRFIEQQYLATIRIHNPNPVALPISGLDYAISLNDSEFASGVSSQRVSVPAYGEKTLEVGVTSTIVKLLDQIRRFSASDGALRYNLTGTLGVKGLRPGIPFQHQGEIDLRLDRGKERPARGRAA